MVDNIDAVDGARHIVAREQISGDDFQARMGIRQRERAQAVGLGFRAHQTAQVGAGTRKQFFHQGTAEKTARAGDETLHRAPSRDFSPLSTWVKMSSIQPAMRRMRSYPIGGSPPFSMAA